MCDGWLQEGLMLGQTFKNPTCALWPQKFLFVALCAWFEEHIPLPLVFSSTPCASLASQDIFIAIWSQLLNVRSTSPSSVQVQFHGLEWCFLCHHWSFMGWAYNIKQDSSKLHHRSKVPYATPQRYSQPQQPGDLIVQGMVCTSLSVSEMSACPCMIGGRKHKCRPALCNTSVPGSTAKVLVWLKDAASWKFIS